MFTTFEKIMILAMSIVLLFVAGWYVYENSEERMYEKEAEIEQFNAEMDARQAEIDSMYDEFYKALARAELSSEMRFKAA